MKQRKKGPLLLILGVLFLALYHILPTLFYYQKSVKKPLEASYITKITSTLEKRGEKTERELLDWTGSFCDLIKVSPTSIKLEDSFVKISFPERDSAKKFKEYFPLAASTREPSKKLLLAKTQDSSGKEVKLQRASLTKLSSDKWRSCLSFFPKKDASCKPSKAYQELILDRAAHLALAISGNLKKPAAFSEKTLEDLAYLLVQVPEVFGEDSAITKRFFRSFSSLHSLESIPSFLQALTERKDFLKKEKIALGEKTSSQKDSFSLLEEKELLLIKASSLVKKHKALLEKTPFIFSQKEKIKEWKQKNSEERSVLFFPHENPFIEALHLDWDKEAFFITLRKDFCQFREKNPSLQDLCEQFLIDEIARISSFCEETLQRKEEGFEVSLDFPSHPSSFLAFDLTKLASLELSQIKVYLEKTWHPSHPDLQRENFPIVTQAEYETLSEIDKDFCLLLSFQEEDPILKSRSLYLFAKGVGKMAEKYESEKTSEAAQEFFQDISSLLDYLSELGFHGYPGRFWGKSASSKDFVFEKENFYQNFLQATQESFLVLGSGKQAFLPLSNLEERIRIENQIETQEQEDLIKAKEAYHNAQASLDPKIRFSAVKPLKSVWWNNLVLHIKKYFRGSEEKVLRWGLDLSGGKTVTLSLVDSEHKPVTEEKDLLQGRNELYQRVNKLGVSEVNIRREGNHLVLDFPGSQTIPASDLLRASSMDFHVVQEKFSSHNSSLASYVNQFLQQVWNEAFVSHKKDPESLQKIAYKHLYGSILSDKPHPRTKAAKVLYENGLRLAHPSKMVSNKNFDTSLCKIAIFRGESPKDWQGQLHPLLLVFHNHALQGKDLKNIRASYDPSRGNFLSFEIISGSKRQQSPQENFYAWTLPFSKESLYQSENDFLKGKGWRMAVILNDTVLCAPTLNQPLKESAMISGSFTPREISQLVADLKAGSLTYSPKILSEKTISPELGAKERKMGLWATFLALVFVITAMTSYYRFSGWVASFAVIFNLLIMWAIFQHLQVTLTLASLAGMVLTVGMAVDANVLVFERMKEEMFLGKTVLQAIHAGYKKAFSAILDSNLTTILAAFILLNFDSGPIKGFALTLVVGIVSSMFTALFATRFFFTHWAEKKERPTLKMANWIQSSKVNFLKKAPIALTLSLAIVGMGIFVLGKKRSTLFGMDFTGGYSLQLELNPSSGFSPRKSVEKAFHEAGLSTKEVQVRELTPSHHLKVHLSTNMEEENRPFFQMPVEKDTPDSFTKNPRIDWVIKTLNKQNIALSEKGLSSLTKSWSSMSGQMSSSMKNQAFLGLLLAFVSMMLYIAFRFEFSFALAALLCTLHDALVTLALVFLLTFLGLPLSFDLHTVAALMTIIGYSINDTIIIFDRIREDLLLRKNSSFKEIVNRAINATLNRTILTSVTTFLVLFALLCFAGPSLFGFSLVMALGVVLGTLSSLFIAPLLLQIFEQKRRKTF